MNTSSRRGILTASLTSALLFVVGDLIAQTVIDQPLPSSALTMFNKHYGSKDNGRRSNNERSPLATTSAVLGLPLAEFRYDWKRGLRFAAVGGLLHGPYFYTGIRWVEGFLKKYSTSAAATTTTTTTAATTTATTTTTITSSSRLLLQSALQKSVFSHLTIFPPYVLLFFSFNTLLEGGCGGGGGGGIGQSALQAGQSFIDRLRDKIKSGSLLRVLYYGTLLWPPVNVITYLLPPSYRIAWLNVVGIGWNSYLSLTTNHHGKHEYPCQEQH